LGETSDTLRLVRQGGNPNRAGGVDLEFVAEVLRVVGPVGGMEGMEEDFWGVRAGGS